MTKREKLNQLLDQYMNEYPGEVVLTLEWNLSKDDAIKLLEERDGREIVIIEEGRRGVRDAPLKYAYK